MKKLPLLLFALAIICSYCNSQARIDLSGIVTPKPTERQIVRIKRNLKQIAACFHQWLIEHGKEKTVTYGDVVGPYIDPIESVVGEKYDSLSASWGDNPFSIELPNGELVTFSYEGRGWEKNIKSVSKE